MYDNPAYNAKNEKILCEMGGKNAEMLMDIRVKLLSAGESVTICDAANETAVMLLAGEVKFAFDGKEETAKRQSPFAEKPYCLHFSKGLQVAQLWGPPSGIFSCFFSVTIRCTAAWLVK